jgi:hypothetical protein
MAHALEAIVLPGGRTVKARPTRRSRVSGWSGAPPLGRPDFRIERAMGYNRLPRRGEAEMDSRADQTQGAGSAAEPR